MKKIKYEHILVTKSYLKHELLLYKHDQSFVWVWCFVTNVHSYLKIDIYTPTPKIFAMLKSAKKTGPRVLLFYSGPLILCIKS